MHQSKYLHVSGLLTGILLVSGVAGIAQEKTAIIPDAQVEANVLKSLAATPQLADQPISTTTVYGQVTLSGSVRDEASRDMAESVTSNTPGVNKVIDQLAIGTAAPEDAQGQNQNSAADSPDSALQQNGAHPPDAQQQEDQPGDTGATVAPPPSGSNGAPQYGAAGTPPNGGTQPQYDPEYGPAGPLPREGQNQTEGPYRRPYSPSDGQTPPPPYVRSYPVQRGGEAVVVPSGTLIRVRINGGMDSKNTAVGTLFDGVVINDIVADNAVAIPRGALALGKVVDAHSAGSLKGKGELVLQLTQITLGGQTFPIVSDAWSHQGADKTGQTVGNAVGLGAFGALIGAVAGGGPGALIGAGVGGAAGLGTSAASRRGEAVVPAEAILNFRLAQQAPLTTVSQEEMNRLATGVQPRQQLRRRRNPPPPPYYYYGPAYYPY
jgi:hypothetical protein